MASRGRPPRHHCPQFSVATHRDGTEDAARVTCHAAVTSAGSAAASRRSARGGLGCDVRSVAAVSPCHPSLPPRPRLAPGHQQQHKQKRPKQTGRSVYKLHFAGLLPSFPGLTAVRCPVPECGKGGCRGRAGSEAVP